MMMMCYHYFVFIVQQHSGARTSMYFLKEGDGNNDVDDDAVHNILLY